MKKMFFAAFLFLLSVTNQIFAQVEESMTVMEGEAVVISLDSPAPGFRWEADEQPDERLFLMGAPKTEPPDAGIAGSTGKETWTFRAMAPGEVTLIFSYFGPEQGTGALQTVTYHVTINER